MRKGVAAAEGVAWGWCWTWLSTAVALAELGGLQGHTRTNRQLRQLRE